LSRIKEIQALIRYGLYYLTEHADDEALVDGLDIYDVENCILTDSEEPGRKMENTKSWVML